MSKKNLESRVIEFYTTAQLDAVDMLHRISGAILKNRHALVDIPTMKIRKTTERRAGSERKPDE
ncbi:MAG: hypothetical protein ACRD22_08865 [Terriglobia bacterium]